MMPAFKFGPYGTTAHIGKHNRLTAYVSINILMISCSVKPAVQVK